MSRKLWDLFEVLASRGEIVSFHYKNFPKKPFYLTVHDTKGNCNMFEGNSIEQLESEVLVVYSKLLNQPVVRLSAIPLPPPMPLPPGLPRL